MYLPYSDEAKARTVRKVRQRCTETEETLSIRSIDLELRPHMSPKIPLSRASSTWPTH